ncbi:hypothetical protein HDU88_004594 [Geranomyces variabilis]|nr:hypothetical protein HDU88_004594 [Geranomyces variabilis]
MLPLRRVAAVAVSRRATLLPAAPLGLSVRRIGYNPDNRAPADTKPPVAAEVWTAEKSTPSTPSLPPYDAGAVLSHPLYTPAAKPNTGIGALHAPLKWPEYDQRVPSSESSGLPSPPNWHDAGFDVAATAPIGDYPHVRPQFAILRDPYKYWDQQGRREYGEVLYDHDQYTEVWSIGPEVHWWQPAKHSLQLLAMVFAMGAVVHWWDPAEHRWFAEKDYPYDGLRIELGNDPDNAEDTYTAAAVYKI